MGMDSIQPCFSIALILVFLKNEQRVVDLVTFALRGGGASIFLFGTPNPMILSCSFRDSYALSAVTPSIVSMNGDNREYDEPASQKFYG